VEATSEAPVPSAEASEHKPGLRPGRLSAVMRDGEQVTPLELFFDLVFVLALTQCTALMAAEPHWYGLAKGLLVLGMLWWAWVGYAWLTSVIDPEEGAVRIVMFAAMGGFLICSLCVPDVFEGLALTFAVFYGAVRFAQIGLFWVASRDEPELRRSIVKGLVGSTMIGVALLVAAAFLDGVPQGAWLAALLLDMAGPQLFGSEGWKLSPAHFAERHGLIVIIALGESIVAIGVGAEAGVDAGVIAAALLGLALAAAMWWAYFDVVAKVAAHRLANATIGREQNEMARDSYSYLHFAMVAGIVMVALGMKKTLTHVGDPLDTVPAFALLGGAAIYLLAHVAFRLRNVHSLNRQRLALAVVLLALLPLATLVPALVTLSITAALYCALIAFEAFHFADARDRIRHRVEVES